MSGHRHPDAETLASVRAGLIGGFRGRRLAAHVAGCARCASVSEQLAAVSSVLASVPAPVMPDAFERQITAALAAEATAREATAREGAAAGPARAASGDPRPRPRHARSPKRSLRLRAAMAIAPVVALLLAGFGYLLSNVGQPPQTTAQSAASAPSPQLARRTPQPAAGDANAKFAASFLVTSSGTQYQAATLRAQVRAELTARSASPVRAPVTAPVPSASSASGGGPRLGAASAASAGNESAPSVQGGYAPSPTLAGCVLSLTGRARPSLVDQATYQGKPVYVIAVADRAWVVGRGCTASNPELIITMPLAGTP